MATLPQELITVRSHTADVSITYDNRPESPGEKFWLATRSAWDAVVDTKAVAGNQADRQTTEDRIVAAGISAYPAVNLNTKYGYGDTWVP